jgi:hypothetical protein
MFDKKKFSKKKYKLLAVDPLLCNGKSGWKNSSSAACHTKQLNVLTIFDYGSTVK